MNYFPLKLFSFPKYFNKISLFSTFTHLSEQNLPTMVDISTKTNTSRIAHAQSIILVPNKLLALLNKSNELISPKGPVFNTAIIAGTLGVKRTADLIPFCHPLPIDSIKINIKVVPFKANHMQENDEIPRNEIIIDCIVKTVHKTGVEMEALTGCSITSLCIYDMCKAITHNMVISETKLISKV